MTDRPRYNQHCREDDVICGKCYRRLPAHLRNGLWSRDNDADGEYEGRIALALNWLDENPA